jgi:hypothetical protein
LTLYQLCYPWGMGSPIKGLVKRKNTSPLKNIDIFFD